MNASKKKGTLSWRKWAESGALGHGRVRFEDRSDGACGISSSKFIYPGDIVAVLKVCGLKPINFLKEQLDGKFCFPHFDGGRQVLWGEMSHWNFPRACIIAR